MKIAIILGTRPEIIKLSPIIRACKKLKINFFILHTGQHYDYMMDGKFFDDLELPKPKYNLCVGSHPYHIQVGLMMENISKVLSDEAPTIALVLGDTNSVLAGALASSKLGVKVGHIEAGLRSYDLKMLEEINRIITDHISDYLFVPTKNAEKNVRNEKIEPTNIFLTGNTIVDAVKQNLKIAQKKVGVFKRLNIQKGKYILVTAHRAENVDQKERLIDIIKGLNMIAEKTGLKIVFPIHPRTVKNIKKIGISVPKAIKLLEPMGYLEFLLLESGAKLIITDSGGLQEEACILKIPCVTIRDNTERQETIRAGVNILAGALPEKIYSCAKKMMDKKIRWSNPFGDGNTAEKIIDICIRP